MRFNEIQESAVDELVRTLPKLHKTDYDSIDKLMSNICRHHNISGEKLHKIFVRKYGQTPDIWIKKYKSKLGEASSNNTDIQKINDFIAWSIQVLKIEKPYPKIELSKDTAAAQKGHHTGLHTPDNKIWVYIGNRNLVDIFRTIFHELVHTREGQLDMIKANSSYPGSPIEALADMMAGKYIKIYGKKHPEIFQ